MDHLLRLDEFLSARNTAAAEGHVGNTQVQRQREFLTSLVRGLRDKAALLEIGFNAGHSSVLFLAENTTLHVHSFDMNRHGCVASGKEYIEANFPGRHRLVQGDSRLTVPQFFKVSPHRMFDVIFIDGGHDFDNALSDLRNCRNLARAETILLVDDTIENPEWRTDWSIGPTKAWKKMVADSLVDEIGHYDFAPGRGMSVGRYIF
jgi:predicted O-methyltransferase YrrM